MLVHNARELGLRMRDQRLELGLSQAALAKQIGVDRAWVIRLERGNAGAEIGLVLKALNALGLDLDVRPAAAPVVPLAEEPWVPDLAEILKRVRGTRG